MVARSPTVRHGTRSRAGTEAWGNTGCSPKQCQSWSRNPIRVGLTSGRGSHLWRPLRVPPPMGHSSRGRDQTSDLVSMVSCPAAAAARRRLTDEQHAKLTGFHWWPRSRTLRLMPDSHPHPHPVAIGLVLGPAIHGSQLRGPLVLAQTSNPACAVMC